MKTFLQTITFIFMFTFPLAAFSMGDVGGGGNLKRDLAQLIQLNEKARNQLMNAQSENEAIEFWIHNLPIKKQRKIMKILFVQHVLPQLE